MRLHETVDVLTKFKSLGSVDNQLNWIQSQMQGYLQQDEFEELLKQARAQGYVFDSAIQLAIAEYDSDYLPWLNNLDQHAIGIAIASNNSAYDILHNLSANHVKIDTKTIETLIVKSRFPSYLINEIIGWCKKYSIRLSDKTLYLLYTRRDGMFQRYYDERGNHIKVIKIPMSEKLTIKILLDLSRNPDVDSDIMLEYMNTFFYNKEVPYEVLERIFIQDLFVPSTNIKFKLTNSDITNILTNDRVILLQAPYMSGYADTNAYELLIQKFMPISSPRIRNKWSAYGKTMYQYLTR